MSRSLTRVIACWFVLAVEVLGSSSPLPSWFDEDSLEHRVVEETSCMDTMLQCGSQNYERHIYDSCSRFLKPRSEEWCILSDEQAACCGDRILDCCQFKTSFLIGLGGAALIFLASILWALFQCFSCKRCCENEEEEEVNFSVKVYPAEYEGVENSKNWDFKTDQATVATESDQAKKSDMQHVANTTRPLSKKEPKKRTKDTASLMFTERKRTCTVFTRLSRKRSKLLCQRNRYCPTELDDSRLSRRTDNNTHQITVVKLDSDRHGRKSASSKSLSPRNVGTNYDSARDYLIEASTGPPQREIAPPHFRKAKQLKVRTNDLREL